jgi:catechol 2,3-dioxygenase-like lactoylglutathione lyase family enzyme
MTTLEFDHVGVNVHDIDRVGRFFTALGFTCEGPFDLHGEWLDQLIGLRDAQVDMITATMPGGTASVEILAFNPVPDTDDDTALSVDAHGYRHVAFRVDDVGVFRSRAEAAGYRAIGDPVETGGAYRMYIAGPEGLFVEFIQPLPTPGG